MNILVFIPWRPMENNRVIAHQRKIREEMALTNPRESASTLDGYSVETISRNDAIPIIMHYEWLRTIGRSTIFVGLLSPLREIEGVACFGWGPGGNIRRMIGVPALCLERGACVHYAPQNAASYLISMACKLVLPHSRCGAVICLCRSDGGRVWRGVSGRELALSRAGARWRQRP
jgi:hypothetical protein